MQLINVKRATGKTELVIKRHLETGYPIITRDSKSKKLIEHRISSITGVKTIKPNSVMTYKEFMDTNGTGKCRDIKSEYEAVIIDDLEFFINDIIETALRSKVDIATMTLNCNDYIELSDNSSAKIAIDIDTANLIV